MVPGDRLVCAFARPATVGDTFEEWLLHVTIVPWFRSDESSAVIADALRMAVAGIVSFEVVMGPTEKFGHNRGKSVNLVQLPSPFIEIEKRVRAYFHQQQTWLTDETTRRRRDYRPHVTAQKSGRLLPGDSFLCSDIYIVEQKGDYKEIMAEIHLG